MTAATVDDVARLFGRAAFGATKNDLVTWTGKPYEEMVASLFPPSPAIPGLDEVRRTQLETATTDQLAAQRWWLDRMRTTAFPLEERMTWFWHTHFATGYAGSPNVGDLMKQNQTIRQNALGSFRVLTQKLTVDGAMLYWLSGYTNRRGNVNENYARELFELFTAGTIPQTYTETDIREAAKALTGWVVKSDRTTAFDTNRHDRTVKTICGTTVGGYPASDPRETTEYQEVVEIALNRPTTAHYVAYKLVSAFAYVPQSTDLLADPDPLVDAVAAALRPAWSIRDAVHTLLTHPVFRYGDPRHVRCPVELAVHLTKVTGVECDPPAAASDTNNGNYNRPIYGLRRMGQVPFVPPNVGGWPKGKRWLSAVTTQARYSLGHYILLASNTQNATAVTPLPASGDLAAWAPFMGLPRIEGLTKQQVQAYLASPGTSDEKSKQYGVMFLIASSPDWQVF